MAATSPTDSTNQPRPSTPIVGREQEQERLRQHLAAAEAGVGGLVLIGGEAGIGKTTLVSWLAGEAARRGALVLSGGCYDQTTTPPYGPWLDLFTHGASMDPPEAGTGQSLPPMPLVAGDAPDQEQATNQIELFESFRRFLATIAAPRPLVLVLEDLHWSDPASLDLLRYLARKIQSLPFFIVATYRGNELTRGHPLVQILPHLVREAQTDRLDLCRLDEHDVRVLVTGRYPLDADSTNRLVGFLLAHTEGNPFFLTEVLRTLEGERLLAPADGSWIIGDLERAPVPPLVRQVIEGRLAGLDHDTRRLLELAAIIGQVAPFDLWQSVSDVDGEQLITIAEQAIDAHLIEPSADGGSVRFTHALIHEAVYESILSPRRRARHRKVGDALLAMTDPDPDPDEVAHHFQKAGDARAVDWLVRAGERAHRVYAWATSAERMEQATHLMEGDPDRARERAWLLHQIGMAMRWTDPERGAAHLDESARVAKQAGDHELAASARAYHGLLFCFTGKVRQGLVELAAGVAELDALAPGDRRDIAGGVNPARAGLSLWLSIVGRVQEGADIAEEALAESTRHEIEVAVAEATEIGLWDRAGKGGTQAASACLTLARSLTILGHPNEARRMLTRARGIYTWINHLGMVYSAMANELWDLMIPYYCDQPFDREQIASATATSWSRAQGAMRTDLSLRATRLPLLVIEGDWADTQELVRHHRQAHANVVMHLRAMVTLGMVAQAQGDRELAWQQVHEGLPGGPSHEPGDTEFIAATNLQRLAVSLALDADDLVLAQTWLEASDRWLAWSDCVLGRASTELLWALWLDASGDTTQARRRGEHALSLARAPRQPLDLLTAQRFLGQLATRDGRYQDAECSLAESLTLADRCAAPFERALTLLALAELRTARHQHTEARTLLDEVRTICAPLDAHPTLERVAALESRVPTARPALPDRLTAREVEVLRLIAAGHSNRQIADTLFLSPRTVERHIANIYLKIDAHTKAEATAYAQRHHLA